MSVLAEPILALVYHNTNASSTLTILGIAIIFVSLVMITNSILQSVKKERIPVYNMLIGGVVKVLINNWLVKNPDINISGAPIGTNACYIVILLLNLYWIKRELKFKFSVVQYVVKPVASAVVMAFIALGVYNLTSFLGNSVALLLSIGTGGVTYVLMIFVLRTVSEDIMLVIPGLSKLVPVMKKYKLLK